MAQVIPLFGSKPEVNSVNSAVVPKPANAPALANQTPETEQVSLHDGDLVVIAPAVVNLNASIRTMKPMSGIL